MEIGGMIYSTSGNQKIEELRHILSPLPVGTWSKLNTGENATITKFLTAPYVQLYELIPEVKRIMKVCGIPVPGC